MFLSGAMIPIIRSTQGGCLIEQAKEKGGTRTFFAFNPNKLI
jgi:hypothetical protein